jgi:DNA-binding NtrC family response regulator
VSEQERILVVDDQRAIRELMRRLLERAGYACATAASSAEAEELLAGGSFALLLADLQMPGESGLDLLARVRDRHPGTAAIVMSGVHDSQLADAATALGACGFLVKPFSPAELSTAVLNALCLRSRQHEVAVKALL